MLSHQSSHNIITPHEANEKSDLCHLHFFGSVLYPKTHGVRRGKLDTSLITRGITVDHTPTSRNATCHDAITRETKSSQHFFVDEAHCTSKADHPSYAKRLLLNNKEKLKTHHKSFDSNLDHHSAAATAIL